MRRIIVSEDVTVRFPRRNADFDEGVEIGLVVAQFAAGLPQFSALMSPRTVAQARELATGFGYRVTVEREDEDEIELTFATGRARPRLSIVR